MLKKMPDEESGRTNEALEKKTDKNYKLMDKLQNKNIELQNNNNQLRKDMDDLQEENAQQERSIKKLKQKIEHLQMEQETLPQGNSNDTNTKWDTGILSVMFSQ